MTDILWKNDNKNKNWKKLPTTCTYYLFLWLWRFQELQKRSIKLIITDKLIKVKKFEQLLIENDKCKTSSPMPRRRVFFLSGYPERFKVMGGYPHIYEYIVIACKKKYMTFSFYQSCLHHIVNKVMWYVITCSPINLQRLSEIPKSWQA